MSDSILNAEACPKCGGTTSTPTVFRGEFVRRDGGASDDWTCDSEWHGVKALRDRVAALTDLLRAYPSGTGARCAWNDRRRAVLAGGAER